MIGALGLSTILLLLAVYLPFFNRLMPTVPLTAIEWGVIILLSIMLVLVNEGINRYVLKTKKPSKAGK
ncbi:MAG: hypothetical protein GX985_00385 [Gallicola sp.]|nr:hypothetical protein [Gallicola sp.]